MKIRGEARKFIERNNIEIRNNNMKYLRDWCKSVQYYIKNQKEIKSNNIKQFMNYKERRRKD